MYSMCSASFVICRVTIAERNARGITKPHDNKIMHAAEASWNIPKLQESRSLKKMQWGVASDDNPLHRYIGATTETLSSSD